MKAFLQAGHNGRMPVLTGVVIKIKGSQFGGRIENVRVSNVIMKRVEYAIDLHLRDPDEERTPEDGPMAASMNNTHFSGITIEKSHIGAEIKGLPEEPLRNISFSNILLEANLGVIHQGAKQAMLHHCVMI